MKQLLPLVLLLLVYSCSHSHSSSHSYLDIEGASGMEIGFGETTIVLGDNVAYHSETRTDSETGNSSKVTINGMPMTLSEGTLRIGDTTVEGINPGDRIELGETRILINGEHRADMPSEADAAPTESNQ